MSSARSFAAAPPAIATKTELDRLTETRPAPASEMHLTPDGPAATDVRQRLDAAHEQRIAALRQSLDDVRTRFEREHAFGQLKDRAKADFGRNR